MISLQHLTSIISPIINLPIIILIPGGPNKLLPFDSIYIHSLNIHLKGNVVQGRR